MTLAIEDSPNRLLSPKETVEYLRTRYGIIIALSSFYSMINRKQSPKPTYFRKRPKFYTSDIDDWVARNLSNDRGGI
jgi:predicted DNA-binding transcriptional regulator AlpA